MINVVGCALNDLVIKHRIKAIVDEYKIKIIVETGTYIGGSTAEFARVAPAVVSIDNDLDRLLGVLGTLRAEGLRNCVLCNGESPLVLRDMMPDLPDETLFFLDAHWNDYWPLRDEISMIRRGAGVIVLHDIVVPGHPEFGFDTYHGIQLSYEYVRPMLAEWSPSHRVEYNDRTEGTPTPRGVAYIFPK